MTTLPVPTSVLRALSTSSSVVATLFEIDPDLDALILPSEFADLGILSLLADFNVVALRRHCRTKRVRGGRIDDAEADALEKLCATAEFLDHVDVRQFDAPGSTRQSPQDKMHGYAWFLVALHRICPEMAVAIEAENRHRRSAHLLDFHDADERWRTMLVDLSEMVPTNALMGSERLKNTLRHKRLVDVPPDSLLYPIVDGFAADRLDAKFEKRIDAYVLSLLRAFPIIGCDKRRSSSSSSGGLCLAGGAALDAMLNRRDSRAVADYDLFVVAPDETCAQVVLEGIIRAMGHLGSTNVFKTAHAVTIRHTTAPIQVFGGATFNAPGWGSRPPGPLRAVYDTRK